jgi:hypothetical protein
MSLIVRGVALDTSKTQSKVEVLEVSIATYCTSFFAIRWYVYHFLAQGKPKIIIA